MVGAKTVFSRFHEEAARGGPRTEEEALIELSSADLRDLSEVTSPEQTRHDQQRPQLPSAEVRALGRGRGTWVPRAPGVWEAPTKLGPAPRVQAKPKPRGPTLRPRQARRLFKRAMDHYKKGEIFDARADALLAQVYDPANPVYARCVERWENEIQRALGD